MISSPRVLTFTILVSLALLVQVDNVAGGTFHWPDEVVAGDPPPLSEWEALGQPDLRYSEFPTENSNARFSSFSISSDFDAAALAALLGVTVELVDQSDFLAFESVGNVYPHFEDSSWTFSSGPDTETVNAPGETLATGIVTEESYQAFFGIPPGDDETMWGFILIDLDLVSGLAEDFSVRVQGAAGVYGRPEIEAMAVIDGDLVPSRPSTWSQVKAIFR